jgi:cystathionine beta-lyase
MSSLVANSNSLHVNLGWKPNRRPRPPPHPFTPFASVAAGSEVSWAATHGPIKTFGLAGICDTLVVTDNERVTMEFRATSSRLHLTRNNVLAMAAVDTAYCTGGAWLDGLLSLVAGNVELLDANLPNGIELVHPEATYLVWLDFRQLSLGVPELARSLGGAGLALSPGTLVRTRGRRVCSNDHRRPTLPRRRGRQPAHRRGRVAHSCGVHA